MNQATNTAMREETPASGTTTTPTFIEKLHTVVNTILAHHGHITLSVTKKGKLACPYHDVRTSTPHVYFSQTGRLLIDVGGALCSPNSREIFERWVDHAHTQIPTMTGETDEKKMGQPTDGFTRHS